MRERHKARADAYEIYKGCTLNGVKAKIIGWKEEFATVVEFDGDRQGSWAWETVLIRLQKYNGEFKL